MDVIPDELKTYEVGNTLDTSYRVQVLVVCNVLNKQALRDRKKTCSYWRLRDGGTGSFMETLPF